MRFIAICSVYQAIPALKNPWRLGLAVPFRDAASRPGPGQEGDASGRLMYANSAQHF
jgi:hypothetical protein